MSGMPLAGVQLVAQDYAPFMAAMQNATKAVEAFGAATTNSGKTAMPALADGAKSAANPAIKAAIRDAVIIGSIYCMSFKASPKILSLFIAIFGSSRV